MIIEFGIQCVFKGVNSQGEDLPSKYNQTHSVIRTPERNVVTRADFEHQAGVSSVHTNVTHFMATRCCAMIETQTARQQNKMLKLKQLLTKTSKYMQAST